MIQFKTVRYKNFMATGNVFTEIKLNKNKTTLIVGTNGVGKSSAIEAITFALYNKAFRKINKPALVNSINSKDCLVELEFDVMKESYKIVRGIKPAVFEIYKNGTLLNQSAADKDYQEILEKQILRMNYRTFCQVVILGSASYVPFMQLAAGARREIIEDLLDIQVFTNMNNLLRDRVARNKEETREVRYEVDLSTERMTMQKRLISQIETDVKNSKKEILEEISSLEKESSSLHEKAKVLESEIDELLPSVDELEKVKSKSMKLLSYKEALITKLAKLEQTHEFYHDSDSCPNCKQSIEEHFKCKMISEKAQEIEEIQAALKQLNAEYNKTADSIVSLSSAVSKYNSRVKEASSINASIAHLTNQISSLTSKLSAFDQERQSNLEAERAEYDQIVEKLQSLDKRKEELLIESNLLSMASALLKDGGIKTRIIKQYIPIMNKLINKYLSAMDFFVNFELDENFEETIKSRGRDNFTYSSFSEGEKARINISILLAWRAIAKMRNTASTNLLILDEIFDSSVDAAGAEVLSTILDELSKDTHIFVISHREALYDKFHSVVKFEKHGNFSRIATK